MNFRCVWSDRLCVWRCVPMFVSVCVCRYLCSQCFAHRPLGEVPMRGYRQVALHPRNQLAAGTTCAPEGSRGGRRHCLMQCCWAAVCSCPPLRPGARPPPPSPCPGPGRPTPRDPHGTRVSAGPQPESVRCAPPALSHCEAGHGRCLHRATHRTTRDTNALTSHEMALVPNPE